MAGDGEQLDSLSLESYEIDDESFNSEDSIEEVDVEDSTTKYQGPIQPYMFEPEVDGYLSEGGMILNQRMKQDYIHKQRTT